MTQGEQLAKAVSKFGGEAKAKLANPAATVHPEDQLRRAGGMRPFFE